MPITETKGSAMTETEMRNQDVTIRMVRAEEHSVLEKLAERDSAVAPIGSVLGAFSAGELVVAASVDAGNVVADPFRPTEQVRALLVERISQLRGKGGRSGGLFALPLRTARNS
jgi:hypothetical protein